jgi:pilus assembly protein Flp/PilA
MLEFYVKFMLAAQAKRDEKGATAVEYGLLVALIAAIIIVVVALLGTEINKAFSSITNKL